MVTSNANYVKPEMIYKNDWTLGSESSCKNLLLKLHGSTNWISSYIHYDFQNKKLDFWHKGDRSIFFAYQNTESEYSCYDGRFISGYDDFSMGYYPPNLPDSVEHHDIPEGFVGVKFTQRTITNPKGSSRSNGVVSMPVIIPPVQHKSYDFYGDLFPKLWNKAEELLAHADKIYILGYSFPRTDIPSNDLFKKAFMLRTSLPDVIIVNPFPDEIVSKFQFEFGIPASKIKVYQDFITEDYILPC